MTGKGENSDAVSMKDYVDEKMRLIEEKLRTRLDENDKAVHQYSKTNDEWKTIHNDLQRTMQKDRAMEDQKRIETENKFVTKTEFENRSRLLFQRILTIVSIIVACIVIYTFLTTKKL